MSAAANDPTIRAAQIRDRLLAAAPVSARREQLAGVATAIHEGGHGPPLVLLHGQGEFWGVWLNVLDELVTTHRVIAVDLPGHGDSLDVSSPLDAAAVLRWVDELLTATCDRRPVIVGHLLGGAVAARYAVSHSDRLAHLVLVDSLGLSWFRPSLRFAVPLVRFMARPTAESRDALFDKCFADDDAVGARFGETWDDLRDYVLDRARTEENARALKTLMSRVGVSPIPRRDQERITVPTTVVHGRDDLQVPLRVAERASRRHGWPLHVIDDCRDDPAAEQPEAFVTTLRAALAVPGPPPHGTKEVSA